MHKAPWLIPMALVMYFSPELYDEILSHGFKWVVKNATMPTLWAALIVFARRFVFVEIPKRTFIKMAWPWVPSTQRRWLRRNTAWVLSSLQRLVTPVYERFKVFRSTPVLVFGSVTLAIVLFTAIYHYTGYYVVVFVGLWQFIKHHLWLPRVAVETVQFWVMRFVAFLNLEWLVNWISRSLPRQLYRAMIAKYRAALRFQIKVRQTLYGRVKQRIRQRKETRATVS